MGEREIIATIYRSAGNESVGKMWTETKVFKGNEPIENICAWVDERTNNGFQQTRVVITPCQF